MRGPRGLTAVLSVMLLLYWDTGGKQGLWVLHHDCSKLEQSLNTMTHTEGRLLRDAYTRADYVNYWHFKSYKRKKCNVR